MVILVLVDSLVFYCIYCTIGCPSGEGKIQWLLNCCDWKETLLVLWLLYLFIYFLCTSWNGLNFALLASIVYWHKVHPFWFAKITKLIMMLIIRERTSKQDEKKKKEKFSKSFLVFINLRNNILHEYKYNGRYFGLYKKCEAIWREKRMYRFCCICIYLNIYWNMS